MELLAYLGFGIDPQASTTSVIAAIRGEAKEGRDGVVYEVHKVYEEYVAHGVYEVHKVYEEHEAHGEYGAHKVHKVHEMHEVTKSPLSLAIFLLIFFSTSKMHYKYVNTSLPMISSPSFAITSLTVMRPPMEDRIAGSTARTVFSAYVFGAPLSGKVCMGGRVFPECVCVYMCISVSKQVSK